MDTFDFAFRAGCALVAIGGVTAIGTLIRRGVEAERRRVEHMAQTVANWRAEHPDIVAAWHIMRGEYLESALPPFAGRPELGPTAAPSFDPAEYPVVYGGEPLNETQYSRPLRSLTIPKGIKVRVTEEVSSAPPRYYARQFDGKWHVFDRHNQGVKFPVSIGAYSRKDAAERGAARLNAK